MHVAALFISNNEIDRHEGSRVRILYRSARPPTYGPGTTCRRTCHYDKGSVLEGSLVGSVSPAALPLTLGHRHIGPTRVLSPHDSDPKSEGSITGNLVPSSATRMRAVALYSVSLIYYGLWSSRKGKYSKQSTGQLTCLEFAGISVRHLPPSKTNLAAALCAHRANVTTLISYF
jgi:hypothetical protein